MNTKNSHYFNKRTIFFNPVSLSKFKIAIAKHDKVPYQEKLQATDE
mgnify:CR=1 FL=1